jgi:flagellar biosynthesis/type III secretory pathway protein FliH
MELAEERLPQGMYMTMHTFVLFMQHGAAIPAPSAHLTSGLQTGYREGVQQGTEQARQRGFESGLAQGGPALWPSGYCTGVLDTLCTFYARPDAPALSAQQRSELDALVAELAALSDEQLLQETTSATQLRTERIQQLLTALELGVVPDPSATKHTA